MKCLVVLTIFAGCGDDIREVPEVGSALEPRVQQAARGESRAETDVPGYLGVIVPRGLSEVTAPFTSIVTELDVRLGDHVTRGQRLALLDVRPLREELAIAKATLKANRAALAQAEVDQRAAMATLERERRAFLDGVSSQVTVSNAEFSLRKCETNIARAAAIVDEQRARIAQLTARVADTSLTAPIDGRVALLYLRTGDHIDEGRPVIRVISSEELYVKFAIPADRMGTLTPGDAIDVRIDQLSITVPGVVRHVAPEIDPVAKMILADADLTTSPARLQPGIDCRIVPHSPMPPH